MQAETDGQAFIEKRLSNGPVPFPPLAYRPALLQSLVLLVRR
jgi:hypothetical protein